MNLLNHEEFRQLLLGAVETGFWLAPAAAALAWIGLLLLPWRPWSTREQLEPGAAAPTDLSDITVLIPARDEAEVIRGTLDSLRAQAGSGLRIVVIDDQSSDATAALAQQIGGDNLTVIQGEPLPRGWAGKIWALEQGRRQVKTELVLLLDADIALSPGMLPALRTKLIHDRLDLVSIMATLRMETFWEKLLVPAFVYFFKLLYPFALGNSAKSPLGVAAGGCILVRSEALERSGAFECLRGAIIDDCTLARKIKDAGCRTWIGLSHAVRSHRGYAGLSGLWNMVARSAFTQLRYSTLLLLGTTFGMLLLFWVPWVGCVAGDGHVQSIALAGCIAMSTCYLPTLRYYGRSPFWVLSLPAIALLYLLMTWTSAIRHWRGQTARWKGRTY